MFSAVHPTTDMRIYLQPGRPSFGSAMERRKSKNAGTPCRLRAAKRIAGPALLLLAAYRSLMSIKAGRSDQAKVRIDLSENYGMPNETTPILQQMQRLIGSNQARRENRERTKEAECDSLGKRNGAGAKA